jgi:hypothetical protein
MIWTFISLVLILGILLKFEDRIIQLLSVSVKAIHYLIEGGIISARQLRNKSKELPKQIVNEEVEIPYSIPTPMSEQEIKHIDNNVDMLQDEAKRNQEIEEQLRREKYEADKKRKIEEEQKKIAKEELELKTPSNPEIKVGDTVVEIDKGDYWYKVTKIEGNYAHMIGPGCNYTICHTGFLKKIQIINGEIIVKDNQKTEA